MLVYHFHSAWLPGGFVGVDVFFVISGYVICGSLLRDSHERFFTFLRGFYTRRLLRIYPALVAMLLVAGVLAKLFIPNAWLAHESWHTGEYAFFGLSNLELLHFSFGYFSPTVDFNPYTHTWSLGVEEQFYLFFPLLLFVILRARERGGTAAALLGALLPSLLALSFLYSSWQTTAHHDDAYYLLPSRAWELFTGGFLRLQHQAGKFLPKSPRESAALVTSGLFITAISAVLADPVPFPFPWAIAPVFGAALCIAGTVVPYSKSFGGQLLTLPFSQYIGRISYSLYLWHWPIIVLLRWTVGIESAFSCGLAVMLTLLLGTFSYRVLEAPIQRQHVSFKRKPYLTLLGGAAVVLIAALFFRRVSLSETMALSVTAEGSHKTSLWAPEAIEYKRLLLGAPGKPLSDKRLFVFGDSHAAAYSEMFQMLRRNQGLSVYVDAEGGRFIGTLVFPSTDQGRVDERQFIFDLKHYSRPGDIVFLACLRVFRFGNQWDTFDMQKVLGERDSREAAVQRHIATLEGEVFISKIVHLGLTVLVDAPMPVFVSPPFRCSDWFNRMNPIGRYGFVMDRDFLLRHRAGAMSSIQDVQSRFPSVQVWDPFWVLCNGNTCSAVDGTKPLFVDTDHLSAYGNRKLYPSFAGKLDALWHVAPK